MRGLRWKVETQLTKYEDPIERSIKMIELFYKGLLDYAKFLKDQLSDETQEKAHVVSLKIDQE